MYRQGLGDCFLLTFDVGGAEKHVLIDCGSLGATATGVKLADVVKDITKVTGGHLDLVVATHEHWDHVAGFSGQVGAAFAKLKVDRVWMAWTENPSDALAQKIAKTKQDLGTSLTTMSRALTGGTSKQATALGQSMASVLGFFDDQTVVGAGAFSASVNEAMTFVRTGLGVKARFLNPGEGPLEEPWLPGFRIFVLGPPRDEQALYDLGENGGSQLYGLAKGLMTASQLFATAQNATEYMTRCGVDDQSDFKASLPFDIRFGRDKDSPEAQKPYLDTYLASPEAWRRIDEHWMDVASDFALQLDSATNNTSLALAIERVADGKVLLFPADAQQGNWLSWQGPSMKWTVTNGNAPQEVCAVDLLSRTVFYKAGHHASHNGTAKGKGLEMMQQEKELTAFIPVDRAVALGRHPPGSWKMPAAKLYRRLLEKCQGRVVRSDLGWAADATTATNKTTEQEFVGLATAAEWAQWRQAQQAATHVTISAQYVDYLLT
jgi:hypothetical protein